MDFLNRNVSINLRRIRKSKQLSLDDVAAETGISKSMLGQIERGEANPTLGTIGKITSGLRVDFMSLVSSPKNESYLIRKQNLSPVKEKKESYSSYVYFPYEQGRDFEIYDICVEPGCSYYCASHGERTLEYLVVSNGTLVLDLDKEIYTLEAGDAMRFHTDCPHAYQNKGEVPLRLFVVFTWR